jgi:hypothetical protein
MPAGVVLASRNVSSKGRRAAALDCTHYLHLIETNVATVGLTPAGAVVTEDVCDLKTWTSHAGNALRLRLGLLALASFGWSIVE